MRFVILILFVVLVTALSSQTYRGIVIDAQARVPVKDCHFILKGSFVNGFTGQEGEFVVEIPAGLANPVIIFSAPGYSVSERPVRIAISDTIRLIPRVYALDEVEISAERRKLLNASSAEKILDFEFLDGHLVLLIAGRGRNLLRLCDANGNRRTASAASVESDSLATDCLGNLQLFSPDSTWQVYYDFENLHLLSGRPLVEYLRVMGNCVAAASSNYYFCIRSCRNLKNEYVYYNAAEKGVRKQLIALADTPKVRMFERDYSLTQFLKEYRHKERPPVEEMEKMLDEYRQGVQLPWTYRQALGELRTQLVQVKDSLYLVNYNDTLVYPVFSGNALGRPYAFPVLRNKGHVKQVYTDRQRRLAHLILHSHSMLTVLTLDLETGKELRREELGTVAFVPKKIIIDDGRLFYLHSNQSDREQPVQLVRYYLK
jgi:hypothetical protein